MPAAVVKNARGTASRRAALLALALMALCACGNPPGAERQPAPAAGDAAGSGGRNSEWGARQPYLVLISIDGFRHDYPDRYPAPALARLAESGVRARALIPVFPTLTFPNHYSIATGLFPAHHGIVANNFPDEAGTAWYAYKERASVQQGRWYGGEPIWVAAERHGMVSAAYFFVGTEAPVGGVSPAHWHPFDGNVPGEARVDTALAWLSEPAATRPHVITLYFEAVDEASHRYGPGSPECVAAIAEVDRQIGRLLDGIETLPLRDEVTVIVVSDHGQSTYDRSVEPLVVDEVVDDVFDSGDFSVVDGGSYAFLFARTGSREQAIRARDAINARWSHGRAWLKEDAPAAWRVTQDSLFPALILQADPHYGVIASADRDYIMTTGDHGWAPEFADMHGIFIAAGPRLPRGERIDPIRAVDVYPLMRAVLNLPPLETDSDPSALLPRLSRP